jgi:hypothetical protein
MTQALATRMVAMIPAAVQKQPAKTAEKSAPQTGEPLAPLAKPPEMTPPAKVMGLRSVTMMTLR